MEKSIFFRRQMKEEIKNILKVLEERGYEAFVVGGYPRDYYLGRKSEDYDICTNATPEQVQACFKEVVSTHYGCTKLVYHGIPVEITTYRKDIQYTGVRTPHIQFVSTLLEDLERRDFIMNTVCMDKEEHWIDQLGAKKDLDEKIIRSVANPFQKLQQDPFRILRAIRFATILDFEIEETLQEAITTCASFLEHLSFYRKKEELDKIFSSPNVEKGIRLLQKFHLGKVLACDFSHCQIIFDKEVLNTNQYPFTREEQSKIKNIQYLMSFKEMTPFMLYQYGLEYGKLYYAWKNLPLSLLEQQYQALPIHHRQDIALSKEKLISLGYHPSQVYPLLEKSIVEGTVKNIEQDLLLFLQSYSNNPII